MDEVAKSTAFLSLDRNVLRFKLYWEETDPAGKRIPHKRGSMRILFGSGLGLSCMVRYRSHVLKGSVDWGERLSTL